MYSFINGKYFTVCGCVWVCVHVHVCAWGYVCVYMVLCKNRSKSVPFTSDFDVCEDEAREGEGVDTRR